MDMESYGLPTSTESVAQNGKLATGIVCPEDTHGGSPLLDDNGSHAPRSTYMGDPWLSIVLPAYNEAECIVSVLDSFGAAAASLASGRPVEIIVVNDASTDTTATLVQSRAAESPPNITIRLIERHTQGGYGRALITGFEAAHGEWLFFSDADGQFEAEQLPGFLEAIEEETVDMVVGFRSPRHDPWHRRSMGWLWSALARGLFQFEVRDVNCAFKAFRRRDIAQMNLSSKGALINTELLHKARRMRLRIAQRPVRHSPRITGAATGANPAVVGRAFAEMALYRVRTLMLADRGGP